MTDKVLSYFIGSMKQRAKLIGPEFRFTYKLVKANCQTFEMVEDERLFYY